MVVRGSPYLKNLILFTWLILGTSLKAEATSTIQENLSPEAQASASSEIQICEFSGKFLNESNLEKRFSFRSKQIKESQVFWKIEILENKTCSELFSEKILNLRIRGAEFVNSSTESFYVYPVHLQSPNPSDAINFTAKLIKGKDSRSKAFYQEWVLESLEK